MCKFIGKSNEWILWKLSKIEILRLYSIAHVAMETTKTSHFTCHSKFSISILFTCQVSACQLQPFSCHYLANDIYSQTAKTVFRHLKAYLSLTPLAWRACNAIFNHWNVAIHCNSRSCGLLKIICPEICFDFLIDWGLVKP